MILRELTKKEWYQVRVGRGMALTGYGAHRAKSVPIDPKNPSLVRGVGDTYYWPWGLQPDEDTIKLIGRRCPIKAAKAFLKYYKRNDHNDPKKSSFGGPVKVA